MAAIRSLYITIIIFCFAGHITAQVVSVSTAIQLQSALNSATPGQTIQIQDGYYERSGGFYAVAGIDGTETNPITVVGSRNVVLSTNNLGSGYAFSLKGNKHWIIKGFTVLNSKNGVVLDSCKFVTVDSILAKKVGQDGIHLRTYSSYCTVKNCFIDSTGLTDYSFGEGIYIGSAYSNWCTYTDCMPDTSNYNQVLNNSFGSFVTAENVDIKEGTKGGLVQGNVFNGTGLQGMNGGDSWIDVKGNNYLVQNNIGNNSIMDGIQTHIQQPGGYGNYNSFSNNTLHVNGPGYGIKVQTSNANGTAAGNVVCTNNVVTGAANGLSNIPVTNCSSPLAGLLVGWNVSKNGNNLLFTWEVSSSYNIKEFSIEQSSNTTDFYVLAEQGVLGTRYSKQLPATAMAGNYFRLVILTVEGKRIYSTIIFIEGLNHRSEFFIQGNRLIIFSSTTDGKLILANRLGQVIGEHRLSRGRNSIFLEPGVYIGMVLEGKRYIYSQKIII